MTFYTLFYNTKVPKNQYVSIICEQVLQMHMINENLWVIYENLLQSIGKKIIKQKSHTIVK